MNKFLIIIFLFFISQYAFSLKNDTIPKLDTAYVQSTDSLLSVKVYMASSSNTFQLKDNYSRQTLKFSPNSGANLGIGFDYKWLGFSLSFGLKNKEIDKKGKTEKFDIGITTFGQKNIFDAKLQLYNGFYIENPWIYDTNWADTLNFPQRADVTTNSISLGWVYVFNNRKFSYKAAFTQNEIQKKSAGSLLIGAFANLNIIAADSAILPSMARQYFSPESNFKITRNLSFTLGAGYVYSLIIHKKFFVTLAAVQGLGVQSVLLINDNSKYDYYKNTLATHTNIRFGLGYNTYRNYWGLMAFADISPFKTKSNKTEISFASNFIKFYYGHRFNFNPFKKKTHGKD